MPLDGEQGQRSLVVEPLHRIVRNAGITAGGNLLGQLLSPLIGVITTRVLGAELYGLYALLVQWAAFVAEIAKAGWGAALVRFVGVYRALGQLERLKGAIQGGLVWTAVVGGGITLLVVLCAEPIAEGVLRHPEATAALRFYAPAIVLTALYGLFLATLTGFQQQRFVQLSYAVVGNLVKLGTLLLLVWAGLDIYAALGSSLLQDVVVLVLSAYFVFRTFPTLQSAAVPAQIEWRPLLMYALTIFATSLFYRYTFQLDVLVLGAFRSAAEVGLYAAALRVQPLLSLPTYAIGETFNPVVAELHARGEREQLQVVYCSAVRWALLLTFPLVVPLITVPEAVLSIFGPDFPGAAPVLPVLSVGTWIGAAFGIAGYVLNMVGKPQVNLLNSIITAGLNVGLFLWLIPLAGMEGAAWAYAVVNIGMALVRVGQVWWLLRLHPWEWALVRALLVIGVAIVGAVAGGMVVPWLGSVMGLAIFGLLIRWSLSPHDWEVWRRWRYRESGAGSRG